MDKMEHQIPLWALKQFAPPRENPEFFDRFKKVKQEAPSKPEHEVVAENATKMRIKELARVSPEFKRTISPLPKAPAKLMKKQAIMKAFQPAEFDRGARSASRVKSEFSVFSQTDKLKNIQNKDVSQKLDTLMTRDNSEKEFVVGQRAKQEVQRQRMASAVAKSENFIDYAQEKAAKTFQIPEVERPDFRAERNAIKESLGTRRKREVNQDDFQVTGASRQKNYSEALRAEMKKRGLI